MKISCLPYQFAGYFSAYAGIGNEVAQPSQSSIDTRFGVLCSAWLRVCSGVQSKGGNKADKRASHLLQKLQSKRARWLLESVIERGQRKNQCAIFLAASRGIAGPTTEQLAAANEDDNGKTTSFFLIDIVTWKTKLNHRNKK